MLCRRPVSTSSGNKWVSQSSIGIVTGVRWTGLPDRINDQIGKNAQRMSDSCLRGQFLKQSSDVCSTFCHNSIFLAVQRFALYKPSRSLTLSFASQALMGVTSTPDPDTFEKCRDTPPISIAMLFQKYALLAESNIYTPPVCIMIRLPFGSWCFCESIRVRGCWKTPKASGSNKP